MRRFAPLLAVLLGAAVPPLSTQFAAAQPAPRTTHQTVPRGANPETGARPGNEIGTGASMPQSNKASNITPSDTRSVIAPNLPSPPIGQNASPRDYLVAARSALVAGRTGEAQQALEMAETRALDRSVPLFQTNVPAQEPIVAEITQALNALGTGDRSRSLQLIEVAIQHASQ